MSEKKISRPNRIVKLPRELWDVCANIAYWQTPETSTQDFIIELLMVLAREYSEMTQKNSEAAVETMKRIIERTNFLNDPANNNRFFDRIKY